LADFCCTVMPWSVIDAGWPLTVTEPTDTCASAVAEPLVTVTIVSTTTFEMATVPATKLWTSECVITVSTPLDETYVRLHEDAPLNGCVPLAAYWPAALPARSDESLSARAQPDWQPHEATCALPGPRRL